jgi:hypothetical protein
VPRFPRKVHHRASAQLGQEIGGDGAIEREARPVWCIFDNTTLGAATGNALALQAALAPI